MKIKDLLTENINRNLTRYLKNNSNNFEVINNHYVFIWTNELLRDLIRNGANTNDELSTVVTPGSIGIGIVNGSTGDICVGAIDHDYDALWASNIDVSDFFVDTKNKNLIRLPNKLQNLADLLADYSPSDPSDPFKSSKSGVAAIIDTLKNNDDYSDILKLKPIAREINKMNDVLDVKEFLENSVQDFKNDFSILDAKFDNDTISDEEYKTRRTLKNLIFDIEFFLKHESHLFKESNEQSEDIKQKLDKWIKSFNRDFPNLDVSSAVEFDPND